MNRREFITLFGGAAAAWPLAAHAQQSDRVRRIGVLLPTTADDVNYQAWLGAFHQGLAKSGWIIGRNVRTRSICVRRPRSSVSSRPSRAPRMAV